MINDMKNALQRISLASQNSMSSLDECGRIAREALAAEEARTGKSQLDDYNEDLLRLLKEHDEALSDMQRQRDTAYWLIEQNEKLDDDLLSRISCAERERDEARAEVANIPRLLDEIERLRAENARLRAAVTLGMHYLKGRYPVPVKEKEVLAQMQTALDSKE